MGDEMIEKNEIDDAISNLSNILEQACKQEDWTKYYKSKLYESRSLLLKIEEILA